MTKIVDGNEEIIREMTEQEYTDFLASQEFWQQEAEAKAAALELAATSKTALLEKLGITEEEARLLLS
jgi:hypothetical protein